MDPKGGLILDTIGSVMVVDVVGVVVTRGEGDLDRSLKLNTWVGTARHV